MAPVGKVLVGGGRRREMGGGEGEEGEGGGEGGVDGGRDLRTEWRWGSHSARARSYIMSMTW